MSEKQVRVDNWGIFFLQRLQLFFSKTDYCDLTLQFEGNVQLKVHRLVLNACTEYFEVLEQSDRLIDENVLLMPEMLQADVVVPIINFMYTGMLEYPMGLYHKLYQAADLMHMTVLTKLLDAQRQQPIGLNKSINKQKVKPVKSIQNTLGLTSSPIISQSKRIPSKNSLTELPSTLPGRKLPVWKRKTVPHTSISSSFSHSDSKTKFNQKLENAAKPTRFEWPDDDLDLPQPDAMDLSDFGDISYTSKPLLREDDVKPILQIKSEPNKSQSVKKELHEITTEETSDVENVNRTFAEKRKQLEDLQIDKSPKKIKIIENEKDTTISVISSGNSVNFDPTKIISEILKKYPHLVKKNKNIKLKIISKSKDNENVEENESPERVPAKEVPQQLETSTKCDLSKTSKDIVWSCKECIANTGKPMEFILYYLYRKHMTDIHNIKFDPRICKYCGIAFAKSDLHSFHLFTKHGIKPSGNQMFPSCSQCPYVALSKHALQIHRTKHEKSEMQCSECKLAFTSAETISNHLQITGHMGKLKRNLYDCQYCMKNSQSAISLLSHIKTHHEAEGRRDGIVSLDEIDVEESVDLNEDHAEEASAAGEYIVSEMGSPSLNKVKIISDVKVPVAKTTNRTEVTLEQSKTHSNVPSSIATSLGLLDIVVLDENQQFILQNQGEQTGDNRTEYILPQIGSRDVRDDHLGSTTDELVMVLTDQDYKDGHSTISADNSNIVVLYSHPADGQQGQFITSQGNLMVNSQTGLLEIRNGATIATTSANQIVMRDSNHIETIEMIQREIDGGDIMKQEPLYEEESKPQVSTAVEESVEYNENSQLDEVNLRNKENEVPEAHHEDVRGTEHEGNVAQEISNEVSMAKDDMLAEQSTNDKKADHTTEEVEAVDNNIGEVDKSTEQDDSARDISELTDTSTMETEQIELESSIIENKPEEPDITKDDSENKTNDSECEPNRIKLDIEELQEKPTENERETEESSMEIDEGNVEIVQENETKEKSFEEDDLTVTICRDEYAAPEEFVAPEDLSQSVPDNKDAEKPYSPTDNPIDMHCEIESNTDLNEKHEWDSINEDENSIGVSHSEMESSTETKVVETLGEVDPDTQDNDNSQSSQESSQLLQTDDNQEKVGDSSKESTKISILDDWDDTDSQQSDNKTKTVKKVAQETVHKLMDDWEEEETEK